ncbi:dihydrolipoamide acetyltransferase family protein [Aurantibacillus circumpalustris]|uniref:dihydrolipoamide acetyltransferase family protein n=1 Tax=Aurantibacillus circumpalustris TaxID=3036359 RepID=UPI00295B7A58|nr:dihydrolipoamide acetyltransferase family protein [Aurantibacillus circumpalustris]
MANFDLIMPKMGESVAEATIIKWTKNEGDTIKIDETVLEIATDKVDSEIPSPFEGTLIKRLFNEGDVVQVGAVIGVISSDANASVSDAPKTSTSEAKKAESAPAAANLSTAAPAANVDFSNSDKFYSPLVKSIAKEEGISLAELDSIKGSGQEGRVTKADILAYIPNRNKQGASSATPAAAPKTETKTASGGTMSVGEHAIIVNRPAVSVGAGDEIVEMDRMRKMIADNMVMSKHVSPHVTSYVEADVTNLVMWRDKAKKEFEKRDGEKLTFTPLFIEAVARAIKDFPLINVSVDQTGTKIIKRKNINIGMAAALPSGNLIVPVIKNADEKNLLGITKAVNDLANRARGNKLQPDEIQGGTFTLTNVGSFGNLMGTPIILQPQVAILAVGSIKKKPAVLETPQGDVIAIRQFMFLSLSYDHRVVDGSLGGTFLRRVADYLEQWDINRPA